MNRLHFKRECPDSLPFDERPALVYFRRLAAPTVLMTCVVGGLLLGLAFGIEIMLVMMLLVALERVVLSAIVWEEVDIRLVRRRLIDLDPSRRFVHPYIHLTNIFVLLTTLLAVISYSLLTR